ncbi:hypothetical protein SCP_1801150 [Sparassis crispa]|uniref:Uncharacterized protein n=1 Tax=Sparassis crispa TaxID=139825 RepID=A0A401H6S6_9APHY|nr:hypothetical protein SCP_1801150 [Sparassis crispa]GBE90091.1 hypothetical protein SCP_1801150 [Sparassis crispa]
MKIGHDYPMSLVDNWGKDYPIPLNINQMQKDQLSELAFLLGGVGDARHVYATLIGLRRAFENLSKAKRNKFHVHFTMLDL